MFYVNIDPGHGLLPGGSKLSPQIMPWGINIAKPCGMNSSGILIKLHNFQEEE